MPDYTIAVNGSTAHVVFEWRIDNLGDSDLFYASTDDVNYQWDCHPVFTQNLYRFRPAEIGGSYGGRFEQIGASWLKHGMLALNQDLCLDGSACSADPSQQLQPNCSDVYSSGLNGDSYILGPRSHANPETGLVSGVQFPHPAGAWAFEVPRGASVALSGIEFNDVNPSSGEMCTCNGNVTGFQCFDDEGCLFLGSPTLPCRSLMARCTNNVHCWAGAPCPSGFVCDSSSMCAPENGPTCTVENAGSVCPSGYDCLAMDYCIRADDWLELETVSNIRWEPAPKQDVTDDPYMTIRPNLIDWGEMNTFRFVADSAATAATLKLDLRNGTSVLIPAVAPLGP